MNTLLALYTVVLGLIPGILSGFPSQPGMLSEHKTRVKPEHS